MKTSSLKKITLAVFLVLIVGTISARCERLVTIAIGPNGSEASRTYSFSEHGNQVKFSLASSDLIINKIENLEFNLISRSAFSSLVDFEKVSQYQKEADTREGGELSEKTFFLRIEIKENDYVVTATIEAAGTVLLTFLRRSEGLEEIRNLVNRNVKFKSLIF